MDTQTHVWLGIIAVVSLVQLGGLITIAIVAGRKLQRAQGLLEARMARLEAATDQVMRDLQPLMRRASATLDDVSDLTKRIRDLDASVSSTVDGISAGLRTAKYTVLSRLWPVAGALHAVAAGARVLRERRRRARQQDDARDIARFMNEGGAHG